MMIMGGDRETLIVEVTSINNIFFSTKDFSYLKPQPYGGVYPSQTAT